MSNRSDGTVDVVAALLSEKSQCAREDMYLGSYSADMLHGHTRPDRARLSPRGTSLCSKGGGLVICNAWSLQGAALQAILATTLKTSVSMCWRV